ncbi:cation diffusion facilitator family transporter [Paenibacillus dokdonensis]|uniref:Cation diffusion facilitator family transporter n=1 Tax=Paenibacillus dokdonensis TaxID=2567944 RepID=A0ABU6GP58_9BACL|nr:cation diffusion facilitator family transporter [Paenibacillus dokdonensis]MEC0241521.1 cation diffusion facilitator family transporter [Paenibacillus dokdonensis]
MDRKKTELAVLISLISNLVLTGLKIVVGLLFKSQVLIADGIHNAGDVVASFAALTSTRISKKPADEDHPYGHGKAEVIASAVVAIILALAALFMVYKSIEALFQPAAEASVIAFVAALISLIWKQWLYVYCMRIGRAENSKSLIATAYDHVADVYASVAAAFGIGIALVGDHYNIPFTQYGDPIAGIIVSYFVGRLAYKMARESVDILMEKNISEAELEQLKEIVGSVPNVKRIDKIRARELGNYIIVDVRVSIPNELTVQQGHDVSKEIKNSIKDQIGLVEEVLVHINPWYKEDEYKME